MARRLHPPEAGAAGLEVAEVAPQQIPGERGNPREVGRRLDPVRRQLVLVQEPPVVHGVVVGELDVLANPRELQLQELLARQPLGPLEAVEPREGRRALEALVQGQQDVADEKGVHGHQHRGRGPLPRRLSSKSSASMKNFTAQLG